MKRPSIPWLLLLAIGVVSRTAPQHSFAKDVPVIKRADSLPATTPWNLDELSKPPEFKWSDGDTIRSLYYKGLPYEGKPTRVFAYYSTPGLLAGDPSGDKNLPAVVLIHGGKGTAYPEWVKLWASRGYAAIAMDLGSRGPGGSRMPDGGPRDLDRFKMPGGGPPTDHWSYHAVADVIRAHSLILSFDEVDQARTAMTGISWGGYLTCIVAGLDNRFKAAVPVYGCGFLHKHSAWSKAIQDMKPEHRDTWVTLWDPSMYVGSATMPMLFVNGGTDFAYPPDSHAQTYALVKSPKQLHFVPKLAHGHFFDTPTAIEVYMDHHLKGGTPLATVGPVQVGDKQVTASVKSETDLVEAKLHYTLRALSDETGPREWLEKPATVTNDAIVAELPPTNATIWFLTVTDDRKTLVSSELVFPQEQPQ